VTTQEEIILDLASAILQPFGIIQSNERARQLATDGGDPRYRCIIDTAQALRSADPIEHVRARACLEHLTALDPGFSTGFSLLAAIYYREYIFDYGVREGDPPALDRALIAARRGIELKPEGSRGYHLLFVVLFARGEVDAAFAAAEKAIALNRYDMMLQSDYGGRLIFAGEIDRGLDILERAQQRGAIRPSWHHFYLFLGHYLKGNLAEARYHANQLASETFALTYLACALVAHAEGQAEDTRTALARLVAIQPGWEEDARAEIKKVIQAPSIVERLVGDLAAAGLASARPR
jgi:tetratricopeptide (TPR) repeat protein